MTQSHDQYIILKTLDNPPRFLFWTLDVVLLFFIIFMMGIIIHISLLILVFPLKKVHSKLKRKFPGSLIKHKMYFSLPYQVFSHGGKCKKLPPSFIEEMLL